MNNISELYSTFKEWVTVGKNSGMPEFYFMQNASTSEGSGNQLHPIELPNGNERSNFNSRKDNHRNREAVAWRQDFSILQTRIHSLLNIEQKR